MIKIDRGIPMPNAGHKATIYPWHDMQVGDSFYVTGTRSNGLASMGHKITGHTYKQSRDGDGIRVWRVK